MPLQAPEPFMPAGAGRHGVERVHQLDQRLQGRPWPRLAAPQMIRHKPVQDGCWNGPGTFIAEHQTLSTDSGTMRKRAVPVVDLAAPRSRRAGDDHHHEVLGQAGERDRLGGGDQRCAVGEAAHTLPRRRVRLVQARQPRRRGAQRFTWTFAR
jgi:hypothetical protein